jgi:hypothetical protein
MNELREENSRGASCAVDSLLEAYYYGMYKEDSSLSTFQGGLIGALNTCCRSRDALRMPCREIREEPWDWLVENVPSYRPKGSHDACVGDGLKALGDQEMLASKFSLVFSASFNCMVCKATTHSSSASSPILGIGLLENQMYDLSQCVEEVSMGHFDNFTSYKLCICGSQMELAKGRIWSPNFVFLELPTSLADGKNQHRWTVPEYVNFWGEQHHLTAAVMSAPHHFSTIVHNDNYYYVLDDLCTQPLKFNTFSGAVSRNAYNQNPFHVTDTTHQGVYLLVYKLCDGDSFCVEIANPNPEVRQCFEGNIKIEANGGVADVDDMSQTREVKRTGKDTHQTKQIKRKAKSTTPDDIHSSDHVADVDDMSQTREVKRTDKDTNQTKQIQRKAKSTTHDDIHCSDHAYEKRAQKGTQSFIGAEDRTITLLGVNVPYTVQNGSLFFKTKVILEMMNLSAMVKNRGYTRLDKQLEEAGEKDAFIFKAKNKEREYISLTACIVLQNSRLTKGKYGNVDLQKDLINVMSRHSISDLSCQQESSSKQPSIHGKTAKVKTKRKSANVKRTRESKAMKVKSALEHLSSSVFGGNTRKMLQTIGSIVTWKGSALPSVPESTDSLKPGPPPVFHITPDDLSAMLNVPTGKKETLLSHVLKSDSIKTDKLSPADVVYLQENCSGTRLFDELRKRLPAPLIASQKQERDLKKVYKELFTIIFLPKRTKTGYAIDLGRLLEVLKFRFYFLNTHKHWRLYGDARVIGKRKSTFIGISPLNDELRLRGFLFQSPKEVFPISIFYGGDSRENLEENLGCPSHIDAQVNTTAESTDTLYLTGDEMYLESALESNGSLGPTSKDGWDIYKKITKEERQNTHAVTGLRTDLDLSIDRQHPRSLFPSIPIHYVVMCLLHGLARCVEKLLNLEIEIILSEASNIDQKGGDGAAYQETRLNNLENNISRRGVRQYDFKIHFDSKGSPVPVSLNKDYAFVIIAPASEDHPLPHVLSSVVGHRTVQNTLPSGVQDKLGLDSTYTEFTLACVIWDHFYKMMEILRKDPDPTLIPGCPLGSLRPEDYTWGYSDQDTTQYVHNAECFYQLVRLRHSYKALTPYMMKFVDHIPQLMRELPFPIARFQTEAGEHANYEHNMFYYQHTTRNGGQGVDPLRAVLASSWKKLHYEIELYTNSENEDERLAANHYKTYCARHLTANRIIAWWQGCHVRKKLFDLGVRLCIGTDEQNQKNIAAVQLFRLSTNSESTSLAATCLLAGWHFILTGAPPKYGSKKMTQKQWKELIEQSGGAVSVLKSELTRQYVVLSTEGALKRKPPVQTLRKAVQRGYAVLDYGFVVEALAQGSLPDMVKHQLNTTKLKASITRIVTIANRHFTKRKSMLTMIKMRRKRIRHTQEKPKFVSPGRHPAQYYALTKRREVQSSITSPISFKESVNIYVDQFAEWKKLSSSDQGEHAALWQDAVNIRKDMFTQSLEQYEELKTYNQVTEPAYKT